MHDPLVVRVVDALRPVNGLIAVVLGGSRARGAASASSDYDFGLYYDPAAPFAVADLQASLDPIVDDRAASKVTARGEGDHGSMAADGSRSTGARSTFSIAISSRSPQ